MSALAGEPTAEKILCRWAESRYGLEGVTNVIIEEEFDPGWSEYTPGEGAYVDVQVYCGDRRAKTEHLNDSIKLMMDVTRFAAWLMASGRPRDDGKENYTIRRIHEIDLCDESAIDDSGDGQP